MIGIRQILRNASTLWGNRSSLCKVLQFLCNDKIEPASLSAARRLVSRGHSRTVATGLPMDGNDDPIPWYTYPFVDFLADLDTRNWKVLEFGSGQSTLYWAARTAKVLSYENSLEWMEKMRIKSPANVELRLFEGEKTLDELPSIGFPPDLVVVDGWKRGACAIRSIGQFGLKPLYILENSDWFPEAATGMRQAGFIEIRFKGFGPINGYAWCTSLLLSEENLARLKGISAASNVPGGLAPGDYELRDLNS